MHHAIGQYCIWAILTCIMTSWLRTDWQKCTGTIQMVFCIGCINTALMSIKWWPIGHHLMLIKDIQRCVVRGIALSSLLSCRLPANLNSRGSSVAPTWAHLCWPGSRSVHGSIHSCVIGRPRFARRGHPKYCFGCLARSRRPPSVNES